MKADGWCLFLMQFDLTGYLCVIWLDRISMCDSDFFMRLPFREMCFIHSDTQS